MHSFKLAGRLILHHDLFRRGSFEPSPTTGDAFLSFFGGRTFAVQATWMPRLHEPGDLTNTRNTPHSENHVNSAASFLFPASLHSWP
jgi:hypothetical protein